MTSFITKLRQSDGAGGKSPSVVVRVGGPASGYATLFVTEDVAYYGYSREDFVSKKTRWLDIISHEDHKTLIDALDEHARQRIDKFSVLHRVVRPDNTRVWVTSTIIASRDAQGEVQYYDCLMRDQNKVQSDMDKMDDYARQNDLLGEILHAIHETNFGSVLQVVASKTGTYLGVGHVVLFERVRGSGEGKVFCEWRNAAASVVGHRHRELAQEPQIAVLDDAQYARGRSPTIVHFGDAFPDFLSGFARAGVVAAAVFPVYVRDDLWGWLCFNECVQKRRWSTDTIAFLANVVRLVSTVLDRKHSESRIKTMALTDPLTGLGNRYRLEDSLIAVMKEVQHNGQQGYMFHIDMDDFKVINDGYGHDYGDMILKGFATFLLENLGHHSEIFRLGGDEFAILTQSPSPQDIIQVLLDRAQLPWVVLGKSFYCTLSIGVVRFPDGEMSVKEVVRNADIAMYQAKKAGKNNHTFYNPAQDNDSIERAEMERQMREAIENNFSGLSVFYQPQTNSKGEVIGAEALLRWTLPDGSQLLPLQFIPLAEYLGLIIPIGEFVLHESVRVCRKVNEVHPDFWISINVSVRQLQQQDFLERVLSIVEETDVNASNIVLEITESMVMNDITRVKALAEEFRQHGIRISMDDFGSGYSSLGNMRELPIDIVKIDKVFIHDVATDAYAESFIRLIVELVHSMGRKVCIEGVETAEQLEYCRKYNADYVQGFHLHLPVPLEEFKKVVRL
ncbi:MAG: EAL domain-containing protein [Burkholderiaceae bacterium]|nr:EAL domain-containing protein [Burkholderiaceae bacterium]